MKLYLDTSSNKQTVVRLAEHELVQEASFNHSQAVLGLIKQLLAQKKKELSDIKHIEVVTGPGSFTGLRVGVSIANALGYALKIPVNDKLVTEKDIVEPIYE